MDEVLSSLDRVAANTGYLRSALALGVQVWSVPGAFHLRHPCGMSLIWGDGLGAAADAVVEHLRGFPDDQWMQIDPRWQHLDWADRLELAPDDRQTRLELVIGEPVPAPGVDGWQLRASIESDYDLTGPVVPAQYWPDAATYLAQGGGVVAARDGRVGAIAFTSFRWDDRREIGILTAPEHRRQGLARWCAAEFIEQTVADGVVPVWSCRAGNIGSLRLAESLGFRVERTGPYLHLPGSGT